MYLNIYRIAKAYYLLYFSLIILFFLTSLFTFIYSVFFQFFVIPKIIIYIDSSFYTVKFYKNCGLNLTFLGEKEASGGYEDERK